MPICECGCKQEFIRQPGKGMPIHFLPGHQFRRPETRQAYLQAKERQRRKPTAGYQNDGLCQCGCGEFAPIAQITNKNNGWFQGFPLRFVHGHNARIQPIGVNSPFFKGRKQLPTGYILVYKPEHPHAKKTPKSLRGYILEHRLIWEEMHGRVLQSHEIIHHINYDKPLSIKENCILLCENCHGLTNFNRESWIKFFQNKLSLQYNYQYTQDDKLIIELEAK